jgi:hypothetical protein
VVQQQAEQQPQQQQLMRLLDELQDEVAAALARVQPDPDALPLEAAPPKGPRQLSGQQVGCVFFFFIVFFTLLCLAQQAWWLLVKMAGCPSVLWWTVLSVLYFTSLAV